MTVFVIPVWLVVALLSFAGWGFCVYLLAPEREPSHYDFPAPLAALLHIVNASVWAINALTALLILS